MGSAALYTFGLLDPAAGPKMADLARRGGQIYPAADRVPGLVDRAGRTGDGSTVCEPGEDFGRWGIYDLPLDLPDFDGHDPRLHIATLAIRVSAAPSEGVQPGARRSRGGNTRGGAQAPAC